MNELTCEICMDLMPLVHDGVASADSMAAVEQHLKTCPKCSALFEGKTPAPSDTDQIMKRIRKKVQLFMAMVMMFGVFFGLSLTSGNELFLNSLIMPVIGCIGYYLFRWKGLYTTPCLLFATHFLTNTLGWIRGTEQMDMASLLVWSGIYSFFAVIGVLIAGLIHFAFRKEKT